MGGSVPHAPEVFGLVALGTTERQNAQIAAGSSMRIAAAQPTSTQTQAIFGERRRPVDTPEFHIHGRIKCR